MNTEEFSDRQAELGAEFAKYVVDNPGLTIPEEAYVFFEVVGDEPFNRHSKELAAHVRAEGSPVVFVRVGGLAPPQRSRLISPEVLSFSDAA